MKASCVLRFYSFFLLFIMFHIMQIENTHLLHITQKACLLFLSIVYSNKEK